MSGLGRPVKPEVGYQRGKDLGKRVFAMVALAVISVTLVAVIPWLLTYDKASSLMTDPRSEYMVRVPLFILLVIIAREIIPRRFTVGLRHPPKGIEPKRRKALVFVHGMGVQDKDEMVTDVSDGIEAFGDGATVRGHTFRIEHDPSQKILHDEISLFVDGGPGDPYQLDCYEAYWGSLFNGVCKWQSAGIFAFGAMARAVVGLGDVVRKKRLTELIQAGLALGFIFFALALIASGTKVAVGAIDKGSVSAELKNKNLNFAGRVIETGKFIETSFAQIPQTLDDLVHNKSFVKLTDLQKLTKNYTASSIVIAIVYSVAWAYMIYALVGTLAHLAGMKLSFRDQAGARGQIYAREWKTLFGQLEAGLMATGVYILLDPLFEMPLVRLAVCFSLLYLVVWGIKYWLTNFLGDVQIFVNANANSSFFKVRESAVDLVADRIGEIAAKKDPATLKPLYDEVYVIGHSLGSAVAVSALRRVADEHTLDPNHPRLPEKICAYITIGSPLRKIRKFYKAQAYKRYTVEFAYETDVEIFGDVDKDPTKTTWYNFWYWSDLFADQLTKIRPRPRRSWRWLRRLLGMKKRDRSYFTILREDDVRLPSPGVIWSHSSYWNDPEWVGRVLEIISG